MCTVQKPVYIPKEPVYISIQVMDGNEESADLVVASDGNSNLEAGHSTGQGRNTCGFITEILLGAAILMLVCTGTTCPCSFHRIRNEHSKTASFLRRAVVEILDFHASPVHQDSPQSNNPSKISAQLRYTPPSPISLEISSMESPSEESYVLRKQKRGWSPRYTSKDVRNNWLERGENSDSINASEERFSSVVGNDSDSDASVDGHVTLKTIESEDDGTTNSSYDDEPDIISPMTPRRNVWK
jgi:hypothetical protein